MLIISAKFDIMDDGSSVLDVEDMREAQFMTPRAPAFLVQVRYYDAAKFRMYSDVCFYRLLGDQQ